MDRYLCFCIFVFCFSSVLSYPFYRDTIPNGYNVPNPCNPTVVWPGVGHKQMAGGGVRNPFGEDYASFGRSWTKDFCEKDSDLDGRTNGQELGDPDCTWTPGTTIPSTNLTHPGICEPVESDKCKNGPFKFSCDGGIDAKECPAIREEHVRSMNLTLPPTRVPSRETSYFCQVIKLPSNKQFHAVAFEPIIDNVNVLHHMALFGCRDNVQEAEPRECGMTISGCRDMIQVWSLGMDGYCLRPDVGVPFGKGAYAYVAMQLHWTNPQQRDDYIDASGLRVYYTDVLRPFAEQIAMFGEVNLRVPPLTEVTPVVGVCPAWCTRTLAKENYNITSAWLHMHYLGSSGKVEQFRDGKYLRTIDTVDYYDYDSPVMKVFDPPLDLIRGDEIRVFCNYNSRDGSRRREGWTYFGPETRDEMCFAFVSYYPGNPQIASFFCTGDGKNTICRDGIPGYPYKTVEECKACDAYEVFRDMNMYMKISGLCKYGRCDPGCQDYMAVLENMPCADNLVQKLAYTPIRESFEPLVTAYLQCRGERLPSYVKSMSSSFKPPAPYECENLQSQYTAGSSRLHPIFTIAAVFSTFFVLQKV